MLLKTLFAISVCVCCASSGTAVGSRTPYSGRLSLPSVESQNEAYRPLMARSGSSNSDTTAGRQVQPWTQTIRVCTVCRKYFGSQIEKHLHQLEEHGDITLRCDRCQKIFDRRETFERHVADGCKTAPHLQGYEAAASTTRIYHCSKPECAEERNTFTRPATLRRHNERRHKTGGNQRKRSSRTRRKETPCSTNRPQAQVHDASRSGSTDDRLQQAKTYPCKMCNRVFPDETTASNLGHACNLGPVDIEPSLSKEAEQELLVDLFPSS